MPVYRIGKGNIVKIQEVVNQTDELDAIKLLRPSTKASRLEELKQLLDSKQITTTEYETSRKAILIDQKLRAHSKDIASTQRQLIINSQTPNPTEKYSGYASDKNQRITAGIRLSDGIPANKGATVAPLPNRWCRPVLTTIT